MSRKLICISCLFFPLVLCGCSIEPEKEKVTARNSYKKPWTILVYMAADNSLDGSVLKDLNEMEKAGRNSFFDIVVYLDRATGSIPATPVILWITNDQSSNVISPIVRTYTVQDSCLPGTLKDFIDTAKSMFPAENYGLVLWSHGTGWFPKTLVSANINFSFGEDDSFGNDQMNIDELANALADRSFSFIVFDACTMGDVEVAYQLRNKANYLMVSQTDELSDGYPYDTFFSAFNTGIQEGSLESALRQMAQSYCDYYESQSPTYLQSACISLVCLTNMGNLALQTKFYLNQALSNTSKSNLLQTASVQKILMNGGYTNIKFDFKDWIDHINNQYPNAIYPGWTNAFARTVIFSAHTAQFLNTLNLSGINGLNVSLFTTNCLIETYYLNLDWPGNSGLSNLAP
jgi:hypothetical protein